LLLFTVPTALLANKVGRLQLLFIVRLSEISNASARASVPQEFEIVLIHKWKILA